MTIHLGAFYFVGFTTTVGAIIGDGKGALIGLAIGLGVTLVLSYWEPRRF